MRFLKNVMVYFLCLNFMVIGQAIADTSVKDLDVKLRELKAKTTPKDQLREKLLRNIDRPEGQKVLEAYGVDKDEFKKRMMAMSERDLREMLENKKQVGGEVIVISLTTLLLVIIILLLID